MRKLFLLLTLGACSSAAINVGTVPGDTTTAADAGHDATTTTGEAGLAKVDAGALVPRTVIPGAVVEPTSRLRLAGDRLYWGSAFAIWRTAADGSQASPDTVSIVTAFADPFEVDEQQILYVAGGWPDSHSNRIVWDETSSGVYTHEIATRSYPLDLVVRGGFIYWIDGNDIDRVATDGTLHTTIATGLAQPQALVVDDTNVYWAAGTVGGSISSGGPPVTYGGGVSRIPITGGASVPYDQDGTPSRIAVGGGHLVWTTQNTVKMALVGGSVQVLATPLLVAAPVAADNDSAYWWSVSTGLVRAPYDGSASITIASDIGMIGDIAVDDHYVYAIDTAAGTIVRYAKDGSGNGVTPPIDPIDGCPTTRLGTAAELALTPRSDETLEGLALTLDRTKLTAPQATYDRVVRDIAAIHTAEPATLSIAPGAPTHTLDVELTFRGGTALKAGAYHAWDCLNPDYGITAGEFSKLSLTNDYFGELTVRGVLNLELLGGQYRSLPEVESAGVPGFAQIPESFPARVCVKDRGQTYDYQFRTAYDITHDESPPRSVYSFSVDAGGTIVDQFAMHSDADAGPAPAWTDSICP